MTNKLRILFLSTLYVFSFHANAQDSVRVYKYWVELKDKAGSPYSVDKPEQFLSLKAIERRKKNNLSIDESDIPVSPMYLKEMLRFPDIKILHTSRWFNAITVQVTDRKMADNISKFNFVVAVKYLGTWMKPVVYSYDTVSREQMGYMEYIDSVYYSINNDEEDDNSPYGKGRKQIEMLSGDRMHAMGYKGKGVRIAILDAGFYRVNTLRAFDSLRIRKQILVAKDFVEYDTSVYEDDDHGMHVLSTIAANEYMKMIGTAPDAEFLLLRTEDANSEYPVEEANWIAAAEYADSAGVDIINSSLGYIFYDDKLLSYKYKDLNGKTALITRAAEMAFSKGIIICNSAGNEGDNPEWPWIGVPADAPNIISVGGVSTAMRHSEFSSFGPTSDGRIKPTICAQGSFTTVASARGGYYGANGTSFSSPVIAGMIVCLMQANPTKPISEIMDAVIRSGNFYAEPDSQYGYGVPDFVVAHTILGNNSEFDYSLDQIVANDYTLGLASTQIRLYCAEEQDVTIRLYRSKKEGKKMKVLIEKTYHVSAKDFLCTPIIFKYFNAPNPLPGFYIIEIATKNRRTSKSLRYFPSKKKKKK